LADHLTAAVIADLHAHYPMHAVAELEPRSTIDRMTRARDRATVGDKLRAVALRLASVLFSDRDWWSGYRISVPYLRRGEVGLALSVLYRPFEEMDLDQPYGAPPQRDYFGALIRDLERVEKEVASQDPAEIRIAHTRKELDDAVSEGATALVHCVEGGFHLGATEQEVERNAAVLSRRGVAYVTLAHLFYRQVATNAPALPFLSDRAYDTLFPQRTDDGLTHLGRAAVRALVREQVMVDISHMRADALSETFELLDREDPDCHVPVIATHAGYRFGKQTYMLDEETIRQIQRRGGVVGLIMAQHQLNDGIRRRKTKNLEDSFGVIRRHIERIHEITGSHDHVAIGSDFDGFIKPTMGGLETVADFAGLEARLVAHYGEDAGRRIASGNALDVLRRLWKSP
jgi:microsomal dipeptidase-like Zn-dependent dipeptidase